MKKILTLAIFFVLLKSTFAQNDLSKIENTVLEKGTKNNLVECLVIMHNQADVSAAAQLDTKNEKAEYVFSTLLKNAEKTQENVLHFLQKEKIEHRNFFIVNAIYVKTSLENIKKLAKMQEIAAIADNPWIHFDEPISAPLVGSEGSREAEWGIFKIKADSVWAQGNQGQGVVIGGQDTGYQWNHPALKRAYKGTIDSTNINHNYNWHDAIHGKSPLSADSLNPCGFNIKAPCDDQSHGTHTMGTMVGDDGLGNQIGVAPKARWIACRNMERGNGSPTTYIESFEWFLAPTDLAGKNPNPKLAPHVINNSWYCSPEEGCTSATINATMELAVKNLKLAGTVVVISAGNSGPGCSTVAEAACSFESGMTVGATDIGDNLAGFSSRGPKVFGTWKTPYMKPNVTAPGVNIRSSIPGSVYAAGWNGTSMAGPHVAGAVALIISANPKLAGKVEEIENILESTATPFLAVESCGGQKLDTVPNFSFGYGRINVLAAVKKAKKYASKTSENIDNQDFMVYPNPSNGVLNIFSKVENSFLEVKIYDVNGRLLLSEKTIDGANISLNIEGFQVGSYFYEVKNEKSISRGKFLKF
jgi:serine protease AprX